MDAGLDNGDSVSAMRPGMPRLMVFRAFLAQNVAVGCAFGGFGVSVLPLQEKFGASRGAATLALALAVLVTGLVSPLIGSLIGRIGLRWTMLVGASLSAAGYALLAVAPSMNVVLALYALPIGIGLAMFGSFPASVLASNWFPKNPGTALGIANMPLFVALLPIVGAMVIRDHGLSAFYLAFAALHLVLLPFLLGVVDGPEDRRLAPADSHGHVSHDMMPTRVLLRRPVFWAMCLGGGFFSAVGIAGVSHLAAFAAEKGIGTSEAATLLSITGGSSVVGSLIVGILCSRLGAARTLMLIGLAFCAGWLALRATSEFVPMALATLLSGAAGAGIYPAINMLSGRLFGIHTLPRAIGLFGLFSLPLSFCLPPLAGVLHDATGNYDAVVAIIIGGSAAAAILFLLMGQGTAHTAKMQPAQVT